MTYKQINKKDKIPLKYASVQPEVKEKISKIEIPNEIRSHIQDLYDLIDYQRKENSDKEATIIAMKHKEAWKRYDKNIEEYDPKTRSYKK